MTNAAQTRATRNYRRRPRHRGVARFEAPALETDRELIRALAGRLAAEPPKSGGILRALRSRVRADIDLRREEGLAIVKPLRAP